MNKKDKIIIRDLLTRGKIGISEKERERPQDILINATLFTDITRAAESDDILDCVDYSEMTKAIFSLVENNARRTMEALTEDIAILCLKNPLVKSVVIRAEKLSAVRFTGGVGIEIEREK